MQTPDEALTAVEPVRLSVVVRRPLAEMNHLARVQARVEAALGQEGRVLVRWSGTEPKLRIMLEGPDEGRIKAWALELVEAARRDVPTVN